MFKIYARSTRVAPVELVRAFSFVAENHKKGAPNAGKNTRAAGLYAEDELVAVAVFCNPRTAGMQKKYTRELLRLTFKRDTQVIGGASKLIHHFLKEEEPWDLFTYQDTGGEASDVYEHAGLKLVGPKSPTKKVLVRDGITYKEAENNRKDWFSLEQAVRRGPDALIGTSLGEIYREDGTRVNNIDLFLENGYHLEEVPGDRVYEWRNPNVSFYTYKITSTKDDGYYIGRHAIRMTNPTIEDCLNDGYLGSGGSKFQKWVRENSDFLRKEILEIHSTWEEIILPEKKLVGDRWKTDPNCMNSIPGGGYSFGGIPLFIEKVCSIHGLVKHRGRSCLECEVDRRENRVILKECEIHGLTKFQGNTCFKCFNQSLIVVAYCPIHGQSKHRGSSCMTCVTDKTISTGICSTHGETKHRGNQCMKCSSQKSGKKKICSIHGYSYHRGNVCLKCANKSSMMTEKCSIHGDVLHNGEHCLKCLAKKRINTKLCPKHGETLHMGKSCAACSAEKSYSMRNCPIHGKTKHKGSTCMKCSLKKTFYEDICDVHGQTKHQGNRCLKCQSKSSQDVCPTHGLVLFNRGLCSVCQTNNLVSIMICPIHGETKFQGNTCSKCSAAKLYSIQHCSTHGETKHRSGSCVKCTNAKVYEKKICKTHGETTFQKDKCMKCRRQKI